MRYTYGGHGYAGLTPQDAGDELSRIRDLHGEGFTPQAVVDEARPAYAVLHDVFEWTDALAAERYRVVQARQLIRSVSIVQEELSNREPIRAFVSVSAVAEEGPARMYTTIGYALSQPSMRSEMLDDASRAMQSFERKYQAIIDLERTMDAVHAAIEAARRKA